MKHLYLHLFLKDFYYWNKLGPWCARHILIYLSCKLKMCWRICVSKKKLTPFIHSTCYTWSHTTQQWGLWGSWPRQPGLPLTPLKRTLLKSRRKVWKSGGQYKKEVHCNCIISKDWFYNYSNWFQIIRIILDMEKNVCFIHIAPIHMFEHKWEQPC